MNNDTHRHETTDTRQHKTTETHRHKTTDTHRHKTTDTNRRKTIDTRRHRATAKGEAEAMGPAPAEVDNRVTGARVITAAVAIGAQARVEDADTAQIKAEGSGQTRIADPVQVEVRTNAPTQTKGQAEVAAPMDGLLRRHQMLAKEANTGAWKTRNSTNGSVRRCWKKNNGTRDLRQAPPLTSGDRMSRKTTNRPCCGASTGRSNISSPNRRDE